MKNYNYVLDFKPDVVDEALINSALDYAWRHTPSKNNFMNYSVHVIGPSHNSLKHSLYDVCLAKQMSANNENFKTLKEYNRHLDSIDAKPNFRNITSAPYVLIYTQRVETKYNLLQQQNINKGMVFEQTFQRGTKKHRNANNVSKLECGMFSVNFASKCLENGIDVSYVGCLPLELEAWQEPEWSFITDTPILIQLAGHGKTYKKDVCPPEIDLKPDFERVVNVL
jgi:hypothetical protein